MWGFWKNITFRQLSFALAVLLYGCFSSPTPDDFGPAEIGVFAFLFLSLSPSFLSGNGYALAFAAYGLSVPLTIAIIHGHAAGQIIRDVIPFIFLLMPLLFYYRGERDVKFLSILTVSVGLIFSLRSLGSFASDIADPMQWLGTPPDLLYLANSPEVLFAAIYLLHNALSADKKWFQRIPSALLACLPLLAMATLVQRASLLYVVACSFIFICVLFSAKRKTAIFIGCSAWMLFLTVPFIEDIFRQLSFKTQMVGLNSRGNEWKEVITHVSSSTLSLLFGKGWGAELENPAVGGLRVIFTHSLLSSLLLKAGFISLFLFLLYLFNLARDASRFITREYKYFFMLAGPLLIGLTLYASYKSFGYGLLILILASCAKSKRLEGDTRPVP
ncbi:MAG: hypothetical protein DI586_10480 [Micavibrio aeruginosavorus]|uniref:O-antigen ligase domain-containing protein n=1 Tax=Micavibrio aeruginosavorus TaxID=349221 RepID=A0A2W5HEH9_9BACT|nr:MAG: hypothetical protein DI586_10480 [Micavibrio aeruginosavorus]